MGQRLIDAEALGIGKAKREAFVVPEIADGWNAVIDIIAHAPTVDAVPVVRCRECRYYNKPRLGWCSAHLDREGPDDFCSYGEREED
jgi:hypothetical protein